MTKTLASDLPYSVVPLLNLVFEQEELFNDFERRFLRDLRHRWIRHEGDTTLSEKQVGILNAIRHRIWERGYVDNSTEIRIPSTGCRS
jgi:hypothetical protein